MKEVREPDPDTSRTYNLSAADLCKVLDQRRSSDLPTPCLEDSLAMSKSRDDKVPQKHLEAAMRTEDLRKQNATIESSEAKTFTNGEQLGHSLADSNYSVSQVTVAVEVDGN